MTEVRLRNAEPWVVDIMRDMARQNHRSMEAEINERKAESSPASVRAGKNNGSSTGSVRTALQAYGQHEKRDDDRPRCQCRGQALR
jgi:hypothetical protein